MYYLTELVVFGIFAVIIGRMVLLNINYWRRRAKLSADEHQAEDREADSDLQQW